MKLSFSKAFVISVFVVAAASVGVAHATHSWGGYHWARTANPFLLKLGDNVSTAWDAYLGTASLDWSVSSVFDTSVVAGGSKRNCQPTNGRVEVCDAKYGANGWLGVAQIWITDGTHITQGSVKMNDTYFSTAKYNTPAWRRLVMCQEIGHTFGLGHQDEDFANANLGTCMDYTNDPSGSLYGQLSNEHPNQHDYDELNIIYAHLDSVTTLSSVVSPQSAKDTDLAEPSEWGRVLKNDSHGRPSLYERDFGGGHKVFTFVFWADN